MFRKTRYLEGVKSLQIYLKMLDISTPFFAFLLLSILCCAAENVFINRRH